MHTHTLMQSEYLADAIASHGKLELQLQLTGQQLALRVCICIGAAKLQLCSDLYQF